MFAMCFLQTLFLCGIMSDDHDYDHTNSYYYYYYYYYYFIYFLVRYIFFGIRKNFIKPEQNNIQYSNKRTIFLFLHQREKGAPLLVRYILMLLIGICKTLFFTASFSFLVIVILLTMRTLKFQTESFRAHQLSYVRLHSTIVAIFLLVVVHFHFRDAKSVLIYILLLIYRSKYSQVKFYLIRLDLNFNNIIL